MRPWMRPRKRGLFFSTTIEARADRSGFQRPSPCSRLRPSPRRCKCPKVLGPSLRHLRCSTRRRSKCPCRRRPSNPMRLWTRPRKQGLFFSTAIEARADRSGFQQPSPCSRLRLLPRRCKCPGRAGSSLQNLRCSTRRTTLCPCRRRPSNPMRPWTRPCKRGLFFSTTIEARVDRSGFQGPSLCSHLHPSPRRCKCPKIPASSLRNLRCSTRRRSKCPRRRRPSNPMRPWTRPHKRGLFFSTTIEARVDRSGFQRPSPYSRLRPSPRRCKCPKVPVSGLRNLRCSTTRIGRALFLRSALSQSRPSETARRSVRSKQLKFSRYFQSKQQRSRAQCSRFYLLFQRSMSRIS